jgi:cell division inhibitor SepF
MGFFDKIKDIVSASDEEEGYEEMENTSASRETVTTNDYYSSSTGRSYDKEKTTQFPSDRKNKNATVSRVNSQLQVALVKPERFEDVPQIADHLADGRTVVLNLEVANRETQRRLLDFLSGAAYAHGGRIKKVANSTYIITPSNVDVMGELLMDELEGTGSYL